MQPSSDIRQLIEIMAALRTPGSGCAWDLEQTHATLAPYALEEAYEVVDAIERGEFDDLRDELGDLLLQIVFHARLAEEAGRFTFGDIVETITSKMLRRHPHVFDAKRPALSGVDKIWEAMRQKRVTQPISVPHPDHPYLGLLAAMTSASERKPALPSEGWDAIKADERRAKADGAACAGVLADVPIPLPGLTRAVKLQKKASAVGFDWGDAKLVLVKIREEIDEIEVELDRKRPVAVADEIGDLMFAVANLARHAGTDPEAAVRGANAKFERRFAYIEKALAAKGSSPDASTLDEMDALWTEAKLAGL